MQAVSDSFSDNSKFLNCHFPTCSRDADGNNDFGTRDLLGDDARDFLNYTFRNRGVTNILTCQQETVEALLATLLQGYVNKSNVSFAEFKNQQGTIPYFLTWNVVS
jgi:hypothetical protein